MKRIFSDLVLIILMLLTQMVKGQDLTLKSAEAAADKMQALKDTLAAMAGRTDVELFKKHCEWFTAVIETQGTLTTHDSEVLSATYDTFCLNPEVGNCREFSSYLNRERPLVIAWNSPTDGNLSFAFLRLPANWEPDNTYPLYIHLHGLSSTTDLPIDYLTRYYLKSPNGSFAYEDGYLLLPWGRGNLWYQGISETDIWESKEALEQLVKTDPKRKYIVGHSMGGYGAWYIASRSPETWAAMGIEAGALWYDSNQMLYDDVIQQLKNLPAYFIVGVQDELFDINQQACNLLKAAGNKNASFNYFDGGHEHLDRNEELMYLWLNEFTKEEHSGVSQSPDNDQEELFCYPSLFDHATHLVIRLETKAHVALSVYNSQGKLIDEIADGIMPAGEHKFDYLPSSNMPGVYFFRMVLNRSKCVTRNAVRIIHP